MKYNSILDISFDEGETTPTEPVSLSEAKYHMRITYTDSDAYITALIKQCRQRLEKYLGLSLVQKDITAHLRVQRGSLELPYGPIQSTVAYTDKDGGDVGEVEEEGIFFKRVRPCHDYLICTYTAGFGGSFPVPEDIRLALMEEVAYRFHHRGEELTPGVCHAAKINAGGHRRVPWL